MTKETTKITDDYKQQESPKIEMNKHIEVMISSILLL
jgi:hypothetical protein